MCSPREEMWQCPSNATVEHFSDSTVPSVSTKPALKYHERFSSNSNAPTSFECSPFILWTAFRMVNENLMCLTSRLKGQPSCVYFFFILGNALRLLMKSLETAFLCLRRSWVCSKHADFFYFSILFNFLRTDLKICALKALLDVIQKRGKRSCSKLAILQTLLRSTLLRTALRQTSTANICKQQGNAASGGCFRWKWRLNIYEKIFISASARRDTSANTTEAACQELHSVSTLGWTKLQRVPFHEPRVLLDGILLMSGLVVKSLKVVRKFRMKKKNKCNGKPTFWSLGNEKDNDSGKVVFRLTFLKAGTMAIP